MSTPLDLKTKLLAKPPMNSKYYLLAIDGRGGSGKTTLSVYLQKLLPDFSVICGDDYFEPIDHPVAWGGYNEERFFNDVIVPLQQIKTDVGFRPYDWDNEPHIVDSPVVIEKGVVIDRCYSFSFDLNYDFKIWVETPRDITLERGISRSTMPRDRAEVVWQELWKPMEDRYIATTNPMGSADIVIDGTKPLEEQIV
ncbi:MAG TPA: hypothetical protein VGF75_02765 [Candidatus Saccharimonadales bacterium]|jgi:uridine kinase